jgi:hypothetical protein
MDHRAAGPFVAAYAAAAVVAVVVAKGPKGGGACNSDEDCNLAGECDQHLQRSCFCDAAWTGSNCQYLSPHDVRLGEAVLLQQQASSWGGRPVASDLEGPEPAATTVDGFFGVLAGSCGLNLLNNVSYIAHTTSTAIEGAGPVSTMDVAIPVLATCVDHIKVNDSYGVERYVMFHNGDGEPRACDVGAPNCSSLPLEWIADCTGPGTSANGTTPDSNVTGAPPDFPPEWFIPSNGVHVATSPSGPWGPPPPGAVEGYPFCDCPAVYVLRNGSVAVWCQGIEFTFQGENMTANVPSM